MRKTYFLAGLAAVALTTSCSEDFDLLGNKHEVTLGATVSAESTRAAFRLEGNLGKFYWNTGDQIGVTSTKSTESFSSLTLKGEGGNATATFSGNVSGEVNSSCYAVYPFSKDHSIKDGKLSYVFPATYTYDKVGQTYFPGTADCNSFNPAMWAKVGSDNKVSFSHLGGIFVIRFGSMPLTEGSLVISTTEDTPMAGTFTADLNSNDEITCKNTETGVANASKKVTINFSGATKDADGVFYVPVPVGTYKNVYVELFEKDNTTKAYQTVSAGSYNITRKLLQPLDLNKTTVDGGEATTAATTTEATTALATSDNVAITTFTADDSGSGSTSGEVVGTITIPAVTTAVAETTQKTVAVEQIPEKAVIKLADAVETSSSGGDDSGQGGETSTETEKSVENVVLSIPNIAISENASADEIAKLPQVEVTMPNTTVTLAGNAGMANFNVVTAATADNTLVVSSGVTIQKLIVKKGNVRIESGATVKEIAIAEGAAEGFAPTIYYETGATLPAEGKIASNCTKVLLSFIASENDFVNAMSNGGLYVLKNDVKLSEQNVDYTGFMTGSGKTVVIDLNKKTLTTPSRIYARNGSLTLKNGKIVQSNGYNLRAGNNGTLTLDHVEYTGLTTNCCIFTEPQITNATVNVLNSKITGVDYALGTNATVEASSKCVLNLENSTFTASDGTGALINIPATVTMKNCTFSGNHQGALLRGGTYEISGCTFTLNAELDASHTDNRWMTAWKAGCTAAFAALTMGNYINDSYKYKTEATFTGTNKAVVSGKNASDFPAIHVCARSAEYPVTITGFANNMTTEGGKSPAIEYGTSNITVDGQTATQNAFAIKDGTIYYTETGTLDNFGGFE